MTFPPMQEITDAADRAKDEAFNNLKFLKKDNNEEYVTCQCCNKLIKIVGRLNKPVNDRIEQIKKRIRRIEEYNQKYNYKNKTSYNEEINALKAELDELLIEEAKRDRFRSLPLYSSKCTGYKFFCSDCWDQAELDQERRRKKKRV